MLLISDTFIPVAGENGILNPNYPDSYVNTCRVACDGTTCDSQATDKFCQIKGFAKSNFNLCKQGTTTGNRLVTGIDGGCKGTASAGSYWTQIVCQ